ncbi:MULTISPECIES: (2Fe-2S)-binding protein [Cupriavidus]|jgi:carbon-monoxide dehydrogenase small subunit|uniref:(2Fe-2S)-binding protein n=1 Tax=Cupriavidus basilensis TaxID=68895 RepID=A0A643G0N1_9BURK|nr:MULTISPECIES: (2Fe-2S)-binding protein [Cupriavidus]KUE88037.1 (2Fe-2S)-binding protein [Cupriavidus necator]NOV23814.1 (2Fe-2S)-binding protein [Cupriavidus necator]QOT81861.1 (2Fe-2S)-binding protein [Cupriavidus basilensis]BDB30277.1 (2Fe-2S)-binding protein [Cupriavidus sp. P-10]
MTVHKIDVAVNVNGKTYERSIPTRMLLSDFLRNECHLTGTHVACEHGVCGACNVMLDGKTVRSCLTFAVQVQGAAVETVESLGTIEKLHPLQQAFWEKHGLQCGFCTPGMLMTAKELLSVNPNPTREEVAEAISGNLCRCTGYQTIVDAIMSAAETMRQQQGVQP